jgi:hypothetical protein
MQKYREENLMKASKISVSTFAILLLAAMALAPQPALSAEAEQIAAISIDSASVRFEPTVKAAGMVLIVSTPDGTVLSREFAPGASPTLAVVDEKLGQLEDGTYTFELRALPIIDKETLAILKTAREVGDEAIVARLQREGRIPTEAMVQSGSFTVANGSFLGSLEEQTSAKDIVHLDDVIITGSLCVGFDCVNGESFGFDTLRLKENNLRIHFQDTSTSASFPSNDWRIVINDTANGGASYFGVEDSSAARHPFRAPLPRSSISAPSWRRLRKILKDLNPAIV